MSEEFKARKEFIKLSLDVGLSEVLEEESTDYSGTRKLGAEVGFLLSGTYALLDPITVSHSIISRGLL